MIAERVITVCGLPAPQGSKRHVGHGVMIESSKKVAPWREAVKWAALHGTTHTIEGPVFVGIVFTLPRPKSAPKRRIYPDVYPDVDKLARSSHDALSQCGAIEDDSKIVDSRQRKLYVGHPDALPHPGAVITIRQMEGV